MLRGCGGDADAAEEGRDVALFPGDVDEAAAGEGCAVEGSEAGGADDEGEDEGADWAEDLGAEHDGYGVAGVDGGEGEDEEVGYIGEDVADYYEGHGRVDYPGEVAAWVAEFADYVVCLGATES